MLGIIAGSGLQKLSQLEDVRREIVRTPFGETSCALTTGRLAGVEVVFLNRHGYGHTLAPHQINYRANVWALQKFGATRICAIGSAGSLSTDIVAGQLVLPADAIDYTHGRSSTYFEGPDCPIVYTDMSNVFNREMRAALRIAAEQSSESLVDGAVYACTNGPRLETPAEVRRMVNDGANVVGMTLMPEAVLAKELGLAYAALTVCTNFAAGVGQHSADGIEHGLVEWRVLREASLARVERVLLNWVKQG